MTQCSGCRPQLDFSFPQLGFPSLAVSSDDARVAVMTVDEITERPGVARPVAQAVDATSGAQWLTELPPGPAAMAMLCAIDLASADSETRLLVAAAWERQHAWVCAQQQAATVAVVGPEPLTPDDWARDELAAGLKLSGRAAAHRVHLARTLTENLPATLELLRAGRISFRHAAAMVEHCGRLDHAQCARVEARVVGRAPDQTTAQFSGSVRRAVLAVAPLHAEHAAQQARLERDVRFFPEPDGMASVIATLPAVEARALFVAVDALARGRYAAAGGKRAGVSIGGCRVDALVALAEDALTRRGAPRVRGRAAQVQVVIDLPTLLGLRDEPAELVGYGPIPATAARALAADTTWRRLVTDPVTGHLLDYGTTVYRPPQQLADYVGARDRTCRFPGCTRDGDYCDIDHVCAHADGGHTSACNCIVLCRRHHRLKTRKRWRVRHDPDATVIWTSPSGVRFGVPPPRPGAS
jgi:hypothetical protein